MVRIFNVGWEWIFTTEAAEEDTESLQWKWDWDMAADFADGGFRNADKNMNDM